MKKFICLIFLLLLSFSLIACDGSTENSILSPNNPNVPTESDSTGPDDITSDNTSIGNADIAPSPYLSIIARRRPIASAEDSLNEGEVSWDEVYYTYDLTKGKLQEICVLPHLSGYTTGIVSLEDNAVYFSRRESDNSNDQICKYDIGSGALTPLEDDNLSYNDLALIDKDTLLVIASTNQHTITPALFDLRNQEFTYMADVNREEFDLYTTGGQLLNYNYLFDNFPWTIFKLADRYSDAYHKQSPEEPGAAIDFEFIMASKDLHKSDAYRFITQYTIENQVVFYRKFQKMKCW
jgi:hypothetical protein